MVNGARRKGGRLWRGGLGRALVHSPPPACAQIIAMSVESVSNAVQLGGAGTTNATLNFGNVSAFGPLSFGVKRTVGGSSYTIDTDFGVRVTRVVSLSPNYTLQARLQSAHPLTWKLDGMTLTTSAAALGTSQPFGQIVRHTLAFVVPFTYPSGGVTTVLEVTAIEN
jgi:hypothetical protein